MSPLSGQPDNLYLPNLEMNRKRLEHVTPILIATPISGEIINKIAIEGCPVEGGAHISESGRYLKCRKSYDIVYLTQLYSHALDN